MSYSTNIAAISRTPVSLVVITQDFCANAFGVAPCTATGNQCFNTYFTCKDRANYSQTTKDYRFSSADAGVQRQLAGQVRPYLQNYKLLPTDISGDITVTQRAVIVMSDEPDSDIGIDPYAATRSPAPPYSSFWRKWIARNPNYKFRYVKIYDGFSGDAESEYKQRFVGRIDSIQIQGSQITIQATDVLLTLDNFTVPPNAQVALVSAITSGTTDIVLSALDDGNGNNLFPTSTGYVRIGDEIVYYSGINVPQNKLTGCTRGSYGTTAAAASANAKVQPCKFYKGNPFDLLVSMLEDDAGIPAGYVDSTAFTYWKDFPATDIDFDALISEPTKLKDLFWEIVNLLDLKVWVGEDLKVTCTRGLQNLPGRTYAYLTDAANIVAESVSVDVNDSSAITRATIFYHQAPIAKADQSATYGRELTAINGDAESANGYGTIIEQKFMTRWVSTRYQVEETVAAWVASAAAHMIFKYQYAQPVLTFDMELKDQDVKTGDDVKIQTDELLDRFGNPKNDYFLITSRDPSALNRITYKAIWCISIRWAFQGGAMASSYTGASDADKQYLYQCDDNGNINDEKVQYLQW